ncbi:MAG: FkbM family methyltransferase [Chlorobium sp.]|uniref:FkbM family methyltransferase n=1 Tax=Chlorobium sp. TaxID=1095 RepID=UPI0025C3C1BB|nr:FkbM family methyltransferase [Chlorobium sp.]MCF8382586.1 FkbM family methyltransferase [Chlorobium sp.]
MGIYNKLKTVARQLIGQEVLKGLELDCDQLLLHDWCICPIGINRNSIVLSLGVGNDIGFDTGMIKTYGCIVHAFDPTPRWIEWIKTLDLPDRFFFHAYAIGRRDGQMQLFPRMSKGRRSTSMMTMMNEGLGADEGISVPVCKLSTITAELGVDGIDILKMDIEASEYEVIEDFLSDDVPVYQLLVEFHHRFSSVPVKKTKESLDLLYKKGYRIFYISEKAREYSLIHRDTYERYLAGIDQ